MILRGLTNFAEQCWPFLGLALLFAFGGLLWPNRFWTDRDTWLGVGCYVLSFFLATSFMHVDREFYAVRVALWQIGIIGTLIMYASVLSWQAYDKKQGFLQQILPVFVAILCAAALVYAGFSPLIEPIETRRGAEAIGFILILVIVGMILWGLPTNPKSSFIVPTAVCVWIAVFVAEFWAAVEYIDCAILGAVIIEGVDAQLQMGFEHSACGDKYGKAYLWIQQAVTGGVILATLIWHHRRLRPWAY